VSLVLNIEDPGEIQYNKYNNKLVFGQVAPDTLAQINLDGSGYEVLESGVSPRGIWIVPAPGATFALGLAGLLAMRRRR
jgi:MYXO-CTERM domain-containing protein